MGVRWSDHPCTEMIVRIRPGSAKRLCSHWPVVLAWPRSHPLPCAGEAFARASWLPRVARPSSGSPGAGAVSARAPYDAAAVYLAWLFGRALHDASRTCSGAVGFLLWTALALPLGAWAIRALRASSVVQLLRPTRHRFHPLWPSCGSAWATRGVFLIHWGPFSGLRHQAGVRRGRPYSGGRATGAGQPLCPAGTFRANALHTVGCARHRHGLHVVIVSEMIAVNDGLGTHLGRGNSCCQTRSSRLITIGFWRLPSIGQPASTATSCAGTGLEPS